jgi:SAM-dependent methyltransferase
MMASKTRFLIVPAAIVAAAAGAAAMHVARRQAAPAEGGILMADPRLYDTMTGWLLGSFYSGVADDVAAAVPVGARVLDVGCGPGHLVGRLADRGLDVAGIDLDPAMIARARRRIGDRARLEPADVASLPFGDGSFDLVVSTLSMHHWADRQTGLAEIARVLKPGAKALVFDLGGSHVPMHGHADPPAERLAGSALDVVDDAPWRWPGPFSLVRRVEATPRS